MNRALALRDGRLADAALLADPALKRAFALLNADGEEARLVGGAVRDALLGLIPGDMDLAVTAPPKVVMARARAARVRCIPTGVEHGTVTLLIHGRAFEVTTLREDIETDGRRAVVRFGRDFRADALRRDFTLNALSVDAEGRIHDDVGGLADLAAGRVRFIGDARTRIREDYLRILRLLRFSARFAEGPLDPDGLAAALAERKGLERLSRERLHAELLKLMLAPRATEVIEEAASLLIDVVAGVLHPARLRRMREIGEPGDALLRLGALAVEVREDAERLRARLALSNNETSRLVHAADAAGELHGAKTPPELGVLRELLFRHGPAALDGLRLAQSRCDATADARLWRSAAQFLRDTPPPRFPVTGGELLARGFSQGKRVGETLKKLQAQWIRAGFPREPEIIARLIDDAVAAREE